MNSGSSAQSPQIVQGRWGFYPCGVEVCRKLRRLNVLRCRSRVAGATWRRWDRKLPHNRIVRRTVHDSAGRPIRREPVLDGAGQTIPIPEPRRPIAPFFIRPAGKSFDVEVATLIEADYRNARYPKSSAEQVVPLALTEGQIDEQIARYETWGEC